MQHDAVDDRAGVGGQPKRDVAHPQRGEHAGQLGFDALDALDGLDGGAAEFFGAGAQGEGQVVEDQVFGAQAVFIHGDVVQAFGHFQLALGSFGHALFIDGQ